MTEKANADLNQICQIISDTVDVEKIFLFGSHAYGTPRADSDYDLCVVIPDGALRPVEATQKIYRALYRRQSTPVDVVVYRAGNFERRRQAPTLERKISREGVLLHERSELEQRMD